MTMQGWLEFELHYGEHRSGYTKFWFDFHDSSLQGLICNDGTGECFWRGQNGKT